MIKRCLEAVCDNCGIAIDHEYDCTKPQMKRLIRSVGGVIQHGKCFCNQECCDKWWVKFTSGQIKEQK